MNKKIKSSIEIILIVGLFIFFSYLVQENLDFFENLIVNNISGIIIFIFIEVTSIVIAPVTTLPLIAVASNLWGWLLTGVISVFAWTLGSWIAFIVGRKYGVKIIKKIMSLERIYKIEKKIPHKHLFWSVVLLRLIIPIDILSYALSIFTKIKTKTYVLATIIGVTPFAFLWAYLGTMRFYYQICFLLIAAVVFLIGFIIRKRIKKKKETSFSKADIK